MKMNQHSLKHKIPDTLPKTEHYMYENDLVTINFVVLWFITYFKYKIMCMHAS